MRRQPSFIAEEDDLPTSTIRAWAEDKYRLVSMYARLLSTGMKRRWDERVYMDLYAGSGVGRVKGTGRLLYGSPLLALMLPDLFDRYIFCEKNKAYLDALRKRAARLSTGAKLEFIQGDCNERIADICALVPHSSPLHRVLTLCFMDPFNLKIKFSTVRRLSMHRVDVLVLLALHMDANRNVGYYLRSASHRVAEFLDDELWRDRWRAAEAKRITFPLFLAERFSHSMKGLGYLPMPFHKMKQVRSDVKNLRLYHLALYSKSKRAHAFWDEVLKYSTDQTSFRF